MVPQRGQSPLHSSLGVKITPEEEGEDEKHQTGQDGPLDRDGGLEPIVSGCMWSSLDGGLDTGE